LKIDSKHPHFTSFVIAKDDILDEIHLREYFIFIFFSGLIFAMILYNLILYFSTRDRLYLHYIVYVIGAYSLIFFMHGYLPLLTDKLALQTPFFITLSVQIELIGLVLFTNLFLNLKENESKLYKINIILLFITMLSLFSIPFAKELKILGPIFLIFLFLTLLYSGYRRYKKGFQSALYYLLATGFALMSFIIYMIMLNGKLLEYGLISYNLPVFGLSWDVIVLSLALAHRIKLLQQENIEKERMLLLNSRQNSIGELTGNVAHQWRQPLSELGAIFAKIEAKLKYATINKDELLASIDKSTKIFKNLSNTIDTFQGFFQHKRNDTLFNVYDELKKTIDFIKDSMDNNNIKITYLYDKEAFLKGNSNEFSQVILNIILNAKDMLIEKNIQDPLILINLQRYEYGFKIIINDNGGGIKIKPIEKIFDSYVTDKQNGTGIGLFIAKTIITQKFNGEIEAYNDKDGAIFEIKFNTKDSISCGFDT